MANQLPGRNTVEDRVIWGQDTRLLNQVQLSVYPDCIGGTLAQLETFIGKHLPGVVGGVHILPFYPSSADRGFAPLTYKKVSEEFGTWEEIQSIAEQGDLCVDFMVNHISAQSKQVLDFVEEGDKVRSTLRHTKLVMKSSRLSSFVSAVLLVARKSVYSQSREYDAAKPRGRWFEVGFGALVVYALKRASYRGSESLVVLCIYSTNILPAHDAQEF
jgi:hypothetical protein